MLQVYRNFPSQLWVLILGSLINRAGSFLVPFLTLYLTQELGFSGRVATFSFSTFGFGFVLAALIGGWLTDVMGRKVVMVTSLLSTASLLLVLPAVKSPAGILIGAFVFALVSEVFRPAASAALADLVPPQHRPQAFALQYLAVNLGFTVATVVGGFLAVRSWLFLFWGDSATCFLFAMILVFGLRETRRQDVEDEDDAEGESPGVAGGGYGVVFRDRSFMVFALACTFLALVFSQALSTFPLFLAEKGYNAAQYGRVMAVNGILIVFLQIPLTEGLARWRRAPVVVFSAALYALAFGSKGLLDTIGQFTIAVSVWTIGEVVLAALQPTIVTDMAPAAYRGRYLGIFNLTFAVAMIVGAPLGGFILERFGGQTLWFTAGAGGLIASLLYASIWRQLDARRPAFSR